MKNVKEIIEQIKLNSMDDALVQLALDIEQQYKKILQAQSEFGLCPIIKVPEIVHKGVYDDGV